MRTPSIDPRGPTVATLRRLLGWTARDLSAESGVSTDTISNDESGLYPIPDERFERYCRAMRHETDEAEDLVQAVARRMGTALAPRHPLAPPPEVTRRLRRLSQSLGLAVEREVGEGLQRAWAASRAEADRATAEALVVRLRRYPQAERLRLVVRAPAFRLWSLPEALGDESTRAAAKGHTFARAWAHLSRRSAEAARVPEEWRPRLRGRALAFWANAQRVGNELRKADRSWVRVWELWRSTPAEGLPLGEWRLLSLEASLRRDQRHWPSAVGLLEQAQAVAPAAALTSIRLKLGRVWHEMGEDERALATLAAARANVEREGCPRERFLLSFTEASSLLPLGRVEEAAPLIDEAQDLAAQAGWELDLLRTVWLRGRLELERENGGTPRAIFAQVRRDFTQRGLALDAALAGLDEALALLREGAHGAVRELAQEMVPIFHSEALRDEAFASWRLFFEAAIREKATVELVRQVRGDLLAAARAPRPEGRP